MDNRNIEKQRHSLISPKNHKYEDVVLKTKRILMCEDVDKIAIRTLAEAENPKKYIRECRQSLNWNNEEVWKVSNPKNKIKCDINKELINTEISTLHGSYLTKSNKKYEKRMSKKYFYKWRNMVKNEKSNETLLQAHQANEKAKLDKLIDNIRNSKQKNEKPNTYTKVKVVKENSSFKNRFKAQTDIIKKQQTKLEEQNKIIEELKLGIIREDLAKSVDNTKINIHEIFSLCSKKIREKMPLWQSADDRSNIMINSHKAPKLVHEMEKRASERSLKRELILERKRQLEEERQRILEEMLEKKKVLEEDDRKRNLEAIKERRRKELEVEKIRQVNKKIYLEKYVKAVTFHHNSIKKKYFEQLCEDYKITRDRANLAKDFYEKRLKKNVLNIWIIFIEDKYKLKYQIADAMYAYKTLKKHLIVWHKLCVEIRLDMQTAEDYYDFHLMCNNFSGWRKFTYMQIILRDKKMKLAESHYKRKIIFHSFYQWKSLPAVIQLEKAKELKKKRWRAKVLEVIPDYEPPDEF